MTSILTNIAAMSALQTLRGIATDMESTQSRVSSGLRVGTASDNAAYWSIATTMRSDNGALSAVQDALGLGAAKVDTAYSAMESAIDVVTEIKNKLVAASEPGVDKSKVQEEITQLQSQLKSIASSASFSGENWLQAEIGGSQSATTGIIYAASELTKQLVGSFIRDADGNVTVKSINVVLDETNVLFDLSGGRGGLLDANALNGFRAIKYDDGTTNQKEYFGKINTSAYYATNSVWKDIGGGVFMRGDTNGVYSSGSNGTYMIKVGGAYIDAVYTTKGYDFSAGATATGGIKYASDISVSDLDITRLEDYRDSSGVSYLGLGTKATDEDLMAALTSFVDGQLEAMNSGAAKLGAVAKRLEMQSDFVSKLTDSIDKGVGRLVDADMNEESTRLKALQTQQQLAIQSLSIANSDSQNILSLFR
ncbi:flagellin [Neorhizobium galegae]|uniref:flagellin N-terminal helical domain-containing protein n=1 Tax=Neorhizobium galegae TaxID=399 RepID=UPI000620F191|nr:flagellin [Neorhizobium galegae]CDZ35598.1 Flagellin protein FlaD [Neorhizobium galegae bv. officinalis]KAA9385925.1 flagellin [Neorhizobium galegae]KAB1113647.1 flagellin [Neorhizobium galegae]MCM2496606.1 flagellin [Neorhizobium galegae]MCQ1764106.1 flagellin [Neorhizobium galegae]